MSKLHLYSLKNIETIICCSKSLILTYKKDIKNLKYIQNGVDLDVFNSKNDNKINVKNRLKLECNKKYFISVGSLSKRKDPLFIAKVFNDLKLKDIGLIFLGSGEEKEKILELNNLNIKVIDNVKNVKDYLFVSDYFISASNSEGLPNSVIEALALRLPVILSDIPSHREILLLNEKSGVIFNKNNDMDLKEKINKILKDEYKEISKEAFKIVENYLNAEKMSNKYCEEYL